MKKIISSLLVAFVLVAGAGNVVKVEEKKDVKGSILMRVSSSQNNDLEDPFPVE